ncbi:hypothetical protein MRB53_006058 [Persea americana]|uniref:Uncharacterized protein n=1 Tax=Persea americana TaxID=3435 RepID=A0ACC2MF64_PERAE|nr:hypothetical protein MRB53_006058 [Persea americana]
MVEQDGTARRWSRSTGTAGELEMALGRCSLLREENEWDYSCSNAKSSHLRECQNKLIASDRSSSHRRLPGSSGKKTRDGFVKRESSRVLIQR